MSLMHRTADALQAWWDWSRRSPRASVFFHVCILCLVLILFVDAELAQALKLHLDPYLFGFFKTITDIGLAGHWYLLFAGLWLLSRAAAGFSHTVAGHHLWLERARSWLYALATLLAGGIVITVLKFVFGRYRPRYLFDQGLSGFAPFSGNNSFPSGHSQVVWSVAIALWFVYPRYRAVYVALALLLSASRVATTVHYLSDTVMGATIAVLLGLWVKDRFEHDGRSVRLPSQASSTARGL